MKTAVGNQGRVALYFLRFYWKKPLMVFVGLLLIAAMVREDTQLLALASLPLGAVGLFLGAQFVLRSVFDDEVFDQSLATLQPSIEAKAKARLHIDSGARAPKIMTLVGFSEDFATGARAWLRPVRRGRDGKYRFLVNRFTVVLLSERRFTVFRCHHDLLRNKTWGLSTVELAYEQITSIKLREDLETSDGESVKHYTYNGREFLPTQILELSIASSQPIRVAATARPASTRDVHGTSIDETVTAIRNELRDRVARPSDDSW